MTINFYEIRARNRDGRWIFFDGEFENEEDATKYCTVYNENIRQDKFYKVYKVVSTPLENTTEANESKERIITL